jgi:hypothetical protein
MELDALRLIETYSASTRLPKKLQRLLTTSQIAQIYNVTLGFENSFLVTYQDKDGRDTIGTSLCVRNRIKVYA